MPDYFYSKFDPRKDKSHYHYSSFEGSDFLGRWIEVRSEMMKDLYTDDVCLPDMELPADFGTMRIITEQQLRACAAALANEKIPIRALESWANFIQRKIDFSNCLYQQYNLEGKKITDKSVGSEAYAFAAYILSVNLEAKANYPERFKWLNAILKCLDVLCFECKENLDQFASYCAYQALRIERDYVNYEATRLGVFF